MVRRSASLAPADARLAAEYRDASEAEEYASLSRFGLRPSAAPAQAAISSPATGVGALVYHRKAQPKGPMNGFGYSWVDDRLKQTGLARPALLDRESGRDAPSFGYEALNLVDGQRPVQAIRDRLVASVGPVPVEEVAAYLATLETLGLLERR
jgi:hypothetical protein